MFKKLQYFFLLILPLVFLLIGFKFDRTRYGTDPESAYLMNGLNIAMGKPVGHYDNPGTTVQMYSALIISVTHFLKFTDTDLQSDVLLNSEYYIEVLRFSLIVLNALVLLLLGFIAILLIENLWAALLLQVAPFLAVTLIEECFTKVAPEPFLFATVSVLVLSLLKYSKLSNPQNARYSVLFGLISGFGLATKMTFLPFLIIPLIVLTGKRNKWIYVFSVPLSFVLFTLPAVTVYPQMAYWFLNLGTHTGTYGSGSRGIIDFSSYFAALLAIFLNNKALLIILLAGIISIIYFLRKPYKYYPEEKKNSILQLISVVIAISGSILMVAKHYHSNHYLFPAFSIMGYLMVLIVTISSKQFNNKDQSSTRFIFPSLFIVITGIALLNIPYLTLAYNGYKMSNQSTSMAEDQLNKEYIDYSRIYYYPGSFNSYASLKWGNVYARQNSSEKLMELFPDGLFFNAMDKCFQLWETEITPEALLKKCKGKIMLVGGPRSEMELKQIEKEGLKLKKVFEGRIQVTYEIDIMNSSIFSKAVQKIPPLWTLSVDFENLSNDNKLILSNTGSKFCTNSSLSDEKSKSGKSSVKLADFDSYGMDYELVDVKPGDLYELSIWRYGNKEDAFLIVSAGQSDPLYFQADRYTETNKDGWQKIELTVKITEEFKSNKLKIYLWNHSKKPVWFDDFSISKF